MTPDRHDAVMVIGVSSGMNRQAVLAPEPDAPSTVAMVIGILTGVIVGLWTLYAAL